MSDWVHDQFEIAMLAHRYAASVDTRDLVGAVDLFTPGATLVLPDPSRTLLPAVEQTGREQILSAFAGLHGLITVHAIVGTVIDRAEHPDAARGRIACIAHHVAPNRGEVRDTVWHLHYEDSYLRTPKGWRIDRRELTIDFITGERVLLSRG